MDGLRSGKIQCEEQSATVEWIHSIMQNIHVQNAQSVSNTQYHAKHSRAKCTVCE